MESRNLKIEDNDVYVLAQSKSFIIINDNYQGVNIYDRKLNFLNTIKVSEGLMIYDLYSSKQDDRIVVFDAENMKLFIVDLNNSQHIVQIEREQIFLNWFVSEKSSFYLRDNKYEYCLSFRNGNELSRKPYAKKNILSYNDSSFLFEKNSELYIFVENEERKLNRKYDEYKNYSLSDNYIIEYGEHTLNVIGDITMKDTISDQSKWIIRKVLAKGDFLIILINDQSSTNNSKLIQYKISSESSLEKIIDSEDKN